ncbi:MAG: MarC family protein [Chloroflexi bacterium]|nr:MarC family protein [Chloroflexota bacterium]
MSIWQAFILTFVPLFIAVDALGNLPFVLTMTQGLSHQERRKVINVALLTAVVVGLAFLFFGQWILNVMGISVGAFAIAGGVILLVLSIKYILTGHLVEAIREEMIAVVPIGTPLVVGPATITTLLLLVSQYPDWIYMVLVSFILNILISWIVFLMGNHIVRFTGQGGLKAVSNVFNLVLAAIAVSMIIRGLVLLGIITVTK